MFEFAGCDAAYVAVVINKIFEPKPEKKKKAEGEEGDEGEEEEGILYNAYLLNAIFSQMLFLPKYIRTTFTSKN